MMQNLIKKGTDKLSIKAVVLDDAGEKHTMGYYRISNEKRIKINGSTLKSLSDLVGFFPVIIMSPEDEDIISGGAQIRRNYIHRILSIIDKKYLQLLREYEKIRRHRNILLQQGDSDQVDLWSEPLASTGIAIWQKRKEEIQKFTALFMDHWNSTFANLKAQISYKSSECSGKEEFLNKLTEQKQNELIQKRTLFGPHKDDLLFMLHGRHLRNFGSQGEKKIFLSVIKKTEAEFIDQSTGKKPVVLLDDLFAKLDSERSKKIINLFTEKYQTFITTTDQSVKGLVEAGGDNVNMIYLSDKN